MIDHLFSAALTFCLLCAGTAAVGSLLWAPDATTHAQVRTIQLPRVVVTGHRLAAPATPAMVAKVATVATPATVAKSDSGEPAATRVQ